MTSHCEILAGSHSRQSAKINVWPYGNIICIYGVHVNPGFLGPFSFSFSLTPTYTLTLATIIT